MAEGIFVLCEQREREPLPASLELIGKARAMAGAGEVTAVAYGEWAEDELRKLICAGADMVRYRPLPGYICCDDTAVGDALAGLIKEHMPAVILMAASIRGRCMAPWIAAKLRTGLTADCTGLSLEPDGTLLQTRPAFGGSLTADIYCRTLPRMATVRPGNFSLPVLDHQRKGRIIEERGFLPRPRIQRTGFVPVMAQNSLRGATVILAGGKGIGSKEGFGRLALFADQIGAALGATRSAVDAGYAPYDMQIGQTGITVRPRLYIAVGISGAVQHIVGMRTAETVIAINNDRHAPIFQYADYGITGDWREILPNIIIHYARTKEVSSK